MDDYSTSFLGDLEAPLSFSTPSTVPGVSCDLSDVSLVAERSVEDSSEEAEVDTFIANGCGCQYRPEKTQCSRFLTKDVITASRQDCLQLT